MTNEQYVLAGTDVQQNDGGQIYKSVRMVVTGTLRASRLIRG